MDVARSSPLQPRVTLRKRLARILTGVAIMATALTSVGLTAPADGPFSLRIRPVLLRVDPDAIAESRAHALSVDVDLKVGALHVHLGWSAIPLFINSTKAAPNPF
jgi:hypothetical protein